MLRRFVAVSASAMCDAMISVIVVCQQNGSSSADALQLLGGGLPLFLRLPDGSVHGEEFGADATVGELKRAAAVVLSRQIGATVDPQNIKLHHGWKSLGSNGDGTPLSDVGVSAEAEIGVRQIDFATILNQFFELLHDEPFHFSKEDFESKTWTTEFQPYEDGALRWFLRIYKDCDCGCDNCDRDDCDNCDNNCDYCASSSAGKKILEIEVVGDDDETTSQTTSGDNINNDKSDNNNSGEDRSLSITRCCTRDEGCTSNVSRFKRFRYSGRRKLWEVIVDFWDRKEVIRELTDDFVQNELQDLLQLIDASLVAVVPNNNLKTVVGVKVIDTLERM